MALIIKFALAMEFADQTFTPQKTSNQAATGFSNVEFQGVFEGNDVAGIDRIVAVDFDRVDRSVAAQVQFAPSRAFNPEHRLSAKEGRAEALPRRIDIDARC